MSAISDLLNPKRTCTNPGGCGNTSTKKQWLKNGDLCPFCNGSDYTGVQSGRIDVAPAASRFEPKAPQSFAAFNQAAAAIRGDEDETLWKCTSCNHASPVNEWVENTYKCPHCGRRTIKYEVTRVQSQPQYQGLQQEPQYQQQQSTTVLPHQRDISQRDVVETDGNEQIQTPATKIDKKYLVGRIIIVIGIIAAVFVLFPLISSIGKSPATNQSTSVATDPSIVIATEVSLAEAAPETQYEQVVITREVFVDIKPVVTPWNMVKSVQLILYILAIIFVILDRIMSNQWYDAVIGIGAAVWMQFGSAAVFNSMSEWMTKIPFVHFSVVGAHWINAFAITIACLVAVVAVSWTGTKDWTPLALFFGLLAGGSEFFGHLGAIQTLFLIPSGEALSIFTKWQGTGTIMFSLLVYLLLLLANYYGFVESLKPYGKKAGISVMSIIIILLSVALYLVFRLFFRNVPVIQDPRVDVGIIFFINFLIAFFLRERLDVKFGNTTAEYKMQQAKVMSPFDVIMTVCFVGLFFIQFLGMV